MMGVDLLVPQPQDSRLYGVTIGIVTNNQDPDGLGRVKVKFPWLSDVDESHWARIASAIAGAEQRGLYWLPEVDDEVLVAFEQGDVAFPYILGGLWNGTDQPPGNNDDGENNQRLLKTRSGHTVVFDDKKDAAQVIVTSSSGHQILLDDTKDAEKIVIRSQSGHQIKVDDKAENIEVGDADGKNKIIIAIKDNAITIATDGTLTLSGQNLELTAKAGVKITAKQNIDLQGAAVNVK